MDGSTGTDKQAAEPWAEELDELKRRRAFAEQMGGEAAVKKHHEAGRMTIRERIARLTDAGSFQEVGKLTGQGHYVEGVLTGVTPDRKSVV